MSWQPSREQGFRNPVPALQVTAATGADGLADAASIFRPVGDEPDVPGLGWGRGAPVAGCMLVRRRAITPATAGMHASGMGRVADRLRVDLGADGSCAVAWLTAGGPQAAVSANRLAWPLDGEALEDLRWYLEDYLRAPFGVWEDRGPAVRERLAGWGEMVFGAVFGARPGREAYQRARDRGLEVVFRSADRLLGLPWELMRDGAGPVALGAGGMTRSMPVADARGRLRSRAGGCGC